MRLWLWELRHPVLARKSRFARRTAGFAKPNDPHYVPLYIGGRVMVSSFITHCMMCGAVWDIDYDPGQCVCDSPNGDEPDDHVLYVVVSESADGQLWTSTCKHIDVTSSGSSLDESKSRWIQNLSNRKKVPT